jgi:hypothetical protein
VSVLDPPLEQRLRDSRLYKDPLAFVPLASVLALPVAYISLRQANGVIHEAAA